MTTSEDLLVARLKQRPFEEVRSAMFRRPPGDFTGLAILAQAGWTKEEYNAAFDRDAASGWRALQQVLQTKN